MVRSMKSGMIIKQFHFCARYVFRTPPPPLWIAVDVGGN